MTNSARGTRKLTSNQFLKESLSDNPTVCLMISALGKLDSPGLSYPTFADKSVRTALIAEITSRIAQLRDDKELVSVSIIYRQDTGWVSPSHCGTIDLSEILKSRREVNAIAPNSISQVVPACTPEGPDGDFVYSPAIITLAIETKTNGTRTGNRQRDRASHGTRVLIPAITDLSDDRLRYIVTRFVSSGAVSRELAQQQVVSRNIKKWGKSRFHREMGLLQMRMLLPIGKAMFAAGLGLPILKHASVSPTTKIKAVKRERRGYCREQVQELWWDDAFRHADSRPRPSVVRL